MQTISRSALLCWFFALLSPILGLISAAILLIRRSGGWVLPLSFSLALIYSYLPVPWDVKNNFDRITLRPEDGLNLYTSALYILRDLFGIQHYNAIFIITFFNLYLIGTSVQRMFNGRTVMLGRKSHFFLIALAFCLFEYRFVLDLQKTTLAFALLVYALSLSNIVLRLLIFFLAVWVHPVSFLVILCLFMAGFNLSRRSLLSLLIFSIVIGFGWSSNIVSFALNNQAAISERVVTYLLIEKSRYSSEVIAFFVRIFRVFSIMAINYAVYYIGFNSGSDEQVKKIARTVFLLGVLAVSLSFNEIMLERAYMAVSCLFIFAIIRSESFDLKIFFAGFTIFVNTIIHGIYTMNVLFSSGYDVVSNQELKLSIAMRLLYMPTLFLLNFEMFGYSNEILLGL